MQIYEALKKDHEKVKLLLTKLLALHEDDDNARKEYLDQIRDELIPHARAEESVFYNSLRSVDAGKKIAMHGYREHMEAEGLLRMLQIRDKMDVDWKDNARKLKDSLESHIHDEETTMFSFAKSILTDQEAEMMAASFERLKPEIKDQGIIQTTWEMVANLMPPRFKNTFQGLNKNPRH
jgi:hemerythrin superfamily protein